MADPVVSALVSSFVEGILGKLYSASFKEISKICGVKGKLKRLDKTLSAINGVLLDAEQRQSSNLSVKIWLHNLKDVAYDIEDALDLISTHDLDRQVNGSRCFLKKKITRILQHYRLAQELNIICCKLEDIADDRRNYNFQEHRPSSPILDGNSERETYSFVEDSQVFGRKHDKEWIVNCLLDRSSNEVEHPRVVPIMAIGGMGKTTLAQLVVNDARVVQNFEVRIWAYISRKFVLKTSIVNIIQSAVGVNYSDLNMEALQRKLRDYLDGKTFVIVLDDVWMEDSKQWLQLKDLMAVGGRKSTIIVTTRDERVASLTGTVKPYKLKELSETDSWSIFLKYAFHEGEEEAHPLLVEIGKSIIRKCRGVPLAVKTLGSLLRHERDYRNWKRIEESELWKIVQGPNDILPALKLSFDHTPHHLRLCFASCALFGKGYPLYRSDLISLWIAHGFLQHGDGSEDALDFGYRCFDELISRSFFQLPGYSITKKHAVFLAEDFNWMHGLVNHSHMSNEDAISQGFRTCDGKVTCVEMHDLVHDLAAYVAGEETTVVSSKRDNVSSRQRHLVWDREELLAEDFPKGLLEAKKARTLAFVYPMGNISKPFLDTLVSNFRCLRILIFVCCGFNELPDSIGSLKHLRYLDLRGNSQVKLLPDSICNLVNLKVLDLGECESLEILPKYVHKLISLRILMLTFRFTRLQERGLQGWSSLQVLKLTFCPNLVSLSEEFGRLKSLRVLIIRVCDSLLHLPNSMSELTNLEHITIHSCRKLNLKEWKGLSDLVSLRFLVIFNLPRLLEVPDLGKASRTLQYLRISKCVSFSSFPESLQDCTSLLKLQVFSCPSLASLPSGIRGVTTLQELRILDCPELSFRCETEMGDYWQLISHIPEINIDGKVVRSRGVSAQQAQAQAGKYFEETNVTTLVQLRAREPGTGTNRRRSQEKAREK